MNSCVLVFSFLIVKKTGASLDLSVAENEFAAA